MLINLSNHPSDKWSQIQLKSALRKYSSVIDLNFPEIPPDASITAVKKLAVKYANIVIGKIKDSKDKKNAVHVMGEMTFCYQIIELLKQKRIQCIASTTRRNSVENNGLKTSVFEFVRFREY